jgi:hypothetical protein
MFQIPALALSATLAVAYAALFYLWRGHGLGHMLIYCVASIAGFALGQAVGDRLHVFPLTLGQVHVVEASLGSLLFLLAASWLMPRSRKP